MNYLACFGLKTAPYKLLHEVSVFSSALSDDTIANFIRIIV